MQTENAGEVLLSVVMPTHNRARYATHAIRSVLAIDSKDIELIVHDTSEDDVLERFAGDITDARLRYAHSRERLSMTENHNRAMGLARGRYVCLVGDDDSILPEAVEVARWAARNGIPAVAPEVVANYAWPDFRSRAFGARHAGRLYLKRRFGRIAMRDARTSMHAALSRAALGTDGLPKVYHGIVERRILEQIRQLGGAYFYGTSPDVSGALGVATMIDRYVWIDFPLTLPGASAGSNTGRSATRTHTGTLEDDPHTKRFRNLDWPDVLPRFVSVETVWAQAAHETLAAIAPDMLNSYNMPRLYATCLLRSFRFRRETLGAARKWARTCGIGAPTLWWRVGTEYVGAVLRTARTLALRATRPSASGGRLFRDRIETIADCADAYPGLSKRADPEASLQGLLRRIETGSLR